MSLATWVYLSIFMVTGSVNRASGVPVGTPGFCGQFLNGFDEFPRPDLSDEATCCATLDRLQEATIEKDGKASPPSPARSTATFRPPATPCRPICTSALPDLTHPSRSDTLITVWPGSRSSPQAMLAPTRQDRS